MIEEKSIGFPIATLHCLITMIENSRLMDHLEYWKLNIEADGLIKKIRRIGKHHENILNGIQIEVERIEALQSAIINILPE
tara:strand:+ start:1134 stop:1376 length:243 start_codon:yes stop_codon:yes gene_type:complete